MNLSNAIDGYLLFKATRASPRTIKVDRVLLRQFLTWQDDVAINTITSENIRAYLASLQQRNLSPHTIKRHYAIISAFYTWLTSTEVSLANHNPTTAVDPPRLPKLLPKALSQIQIQALLDAVTASHNPRRDKALLLFLLDTGARALEICGVTMPDVDFSSGKIRVTGKGNKERYVYLGRRALAALWLYVNDERPTPAMARDEHLFLIDDGYPFTRCTLRNLMNRLSARAGFHAHPHQFRHTAAIEHLRHGMDLASLQHLLGHANITTPRHYLAALSDDDVEKCAKRTSPTDNWRL